MSAPFEKRLLADVCWAFGTRYPDRSTFEAAVRQYHLDILDSDDRWQPETLALPCTEVKIHFEYWEFEPEEREVEVIVSLSSLRPEGFTVGDLLFLIHKEGSEKLAGMDHKFFEGLVFWRTDDQGVPIYMMRLGS